MTENEAKTMLEAYTECDRIKNDVAYEKQCHKDCDNCKLCYAKGTVGEHREALNIAIKALEKQIPKKVIKWANGTEHCPTCDCDNSCIGYGVCIDCGQKLDWSDTD